MKKISLIVIAIVIIAIIGLAYYFVSQNKNNVSKNNNALPPKTENPPATNEKTNPSKESDGLYVGDDFTIASPPSWIQTHMQSTLVSFQDPKETQPENSAAAKINFKSYIAVSFDNTQGNTLDETVKLVKQQTQGVAPAISFDSETDGTIDSQPAKFMEASLNQQDVDFKVLMVIIVKDDRYFTISANTTAQKWTEYRDVFYKTANSFKFKK